MTNTNYLDLNAEVNLWDGDGKLQIHKDKEAAREFFRNHVNANTVFFHDLEEKTEYLVDNGYWDSEVINRYSFAEFKELMKFAYGFKHRFDSLLGAMKFYSSYAMRTNDGERYLERFEDRVVMNAMAYSENISHAKDLIEAIITKRYQPATPTFMNAGRANSGAPVSCFADGTRVLTSEGYRPIETVKIGDKVASHDGKLHDVEAIQSHNSDSLKEIRVVGSVNNIFATDNHPFLATLSSKSVVEHTGDGDSENLGWVQAGSLSPGDFVAAFVPDYSALSRTSISLAPYAEEAWGEVVEHEGMLYRETSDRKKNRKKGHNRDLVHKPVPASAPLSPELGYLFGLFLAEGYVHRTNGVVKGVRYTFNSKDTDLVEEAVAGIENVFGTSPVVNVNKDGSTNVSLWSKVVGLMFEDLFGTGFDRKRIPEWAIGSNKEFARKLALGIFRGDGCMYHNGNTLSLTNPELAQDVRDLLHVLGILNYSKQRVTSSEKMAGIVTVPRCNEVNDQFLKDIGENYGKVGALPSEKNAKWVDGRPSYRVMSVEDSSPEKVTNLQVKDSHTYVVEDLNVHNCFLLRIDDNLESIVRAQSDASQLSKRGGGVGLLLTNIREEGAPIKGREGVAKGVVPVMKILEDTFSYVDQLGQRQGAGVTYLHAHHPDIMKFLDTKRENADEKIRIKSLSLGVVIPDITFELAKNNEDMYLFSPYDVERVYGVPFSEISVSEKYREMVDNPKIRKSKVNTRKFFQTLAEVQFESGYPYVLFEDAANRANPAPNVGRIQMSNLCVAPETRLLTDKGYLPIGELAGQTVNAWNGEKFSPSLVAKTGENQELITVAFSNGGSLDVTPYHKFYVKNDYHKPAVEVSAAELVEGDRLEKFELDVIDAPAEDFPRAYTAGLHTAEGTYSKSGSPLLRLYPGKLHLGESIEYKSSSLKEDAGGRVSYVLHEDTPEKFSVPTGYSLRSRLEWLAGLIDGDGYGNGAVGIQIASIHAGFLEEVRVLLTTLGVHSKWTKLKDAGETDFGDGYGPYPTKETYRLVVSGSEAQKLRKLGLPTKRVVIEEYEHQRSAREFVKVTGVIATGRIDDTYCLNEPERHKVVFEGIQTGNCSEILQPQTGSTFNEAGEFVDVGRDISCNLGSLNIDRVADLDTEDFLRTIRAAYRMLNKVAEDSDEDLACSPTVRRGNHATRAIGLGQMNLHGALIKRKLDYDSPEAREFFRSYMADVTLAIITESNLKAIEQEGTFSGFDGSRWQDGSIIQEMFDNAGPEASRRFDDDEWEFLKDKVSRHGLWNQHLQAIPPTGSISYVNGATSSIHPITAHIEARKEGRTGRIYYPAYGLTDENIHKVKDAYDLGYEALIDMYAVAAPFVDQGMSMTLFFKDTATTRDLNKAQIYAHKAGVKSIYYIRMRNTVLAGTSMEECVSCAV